QQGSFISADNLSITADKQLSVTGSQIVGTQNVALSAGEQVTIKAAENRYQQQEQHVSKTSGLFSGGGLALTIGKDKERTVSDNTNKDYLNSTIGSTAGSVSIKAGQDVTL